MLAFILDSCKHYWVSIQRGRAGHCSQARQVFWAGFCFFSVIVIIVIIICSIQSGGHCSQVRQVFVGCLQKEANKETATHKKGLFCKLLQNCPQVISPGPKLKRCSLSGKIKVMQSKCGIVKEILAKLQSELLCLSVEFAITVEIETLQSELKDQFHVCTVSQWKELNRQLER